MKAMQSVLVLFTVLFGMNAFAVKVTEEEFDKLEDKLQDAAQGDWICESNSNESFPTVGYKEFTDFTVKSDKKTIVYTLTFKHEETKAISVAKYYISKNTGKMYSASREVLTQVRFLDESFSEVKSPVRYMSLALETCKPE